MRLASTDIVGMSSLIASSQRTSGDCPIDVSRSAGRSCSFEPDIFVDFHLSFRMPADTYWEGCLTPSLVQLGICDVAMSGAIEQALNNAYVLLPLFNGLVRKRAGLEGRAHPHLLRHTPGDHAQWRYGRKSLSEACSVTRTEDLQRRRFTPELNEMPRKASIWAACGELTKQKGRTNSGSTKSHRRLRRCLDDLLTIPFAETFVGAVLALIPPATVKTDAGDTISGGAGRVRA